ncbi:MAG: hypothetical protein M0P69_13340 [Bacteroidales bacterium]|nr:hypothetical protein [Bacteroidales bacterium]
MGFGVSTDYFGLAEEGVWELQGSSYTPENSSSQVQNEFGDVTAEAEYEKTATVENTYRLVGNGTDGSITLPANFKAGYTNVVGSDTFVITGGSLATSNTERPLLTVTGEKMHGVTTALRIYDFATAIGSILARKVATAIGFVLGSNTLLNSCSVSFSCETARALDSDGAIAIKDTFNGRVESTGEMVSATTVADATAASGWTIPAGTSKSEENTAHPSGSITVYKNLAAEEA